MLEPIEDETAMSPLPWRATITEVSKSGTDVPAARNVSPITASGIPKAQPTSVAHQTIRYEYTPTLPSDQIGQVFVWNKTVRSTRQPHR
jgi:hypothetical protein